MAASQLPIATALDDTRTFLEPGSGARPGAHDSKHLLVIEGERSSLHALPELGEVVIGRAPECTLRLEDSTASRRHARLVLGPDEATIEDLGSYNGTLVNGVALDAPRTLAAGDVISVCGATLVFQRAARAPKSFALRTATELHRKIGVEIERGRSAGRAVGLLAFELASEERAHVASAVALLAKLCLPADDYFIQGDTSFVVLTERSAARAEADAAQIFQHLAKSAVATRGARGVSPIDAGDADALLGLVKAALASAKAGQLVGTDAAVVIREVGPHRVILADPGMLGIYTLIDKLARSELPVLVLGESGTGKELAAYAIHDGSRRRSGRLVTINCAALPETLAESELFGYEKGAFSGAMSSKIGLLEAADGGTLLLDEIGELPLVLQAKLLRVLETKRLTRLGALDERPADFRLVAATNRDLDAERAAGRFRQDLLYRLGGARVTLPPLRSRRRELPILAQTFLDAARANSGMVPAKLSATALERIFAHPWQGNVRELRNAMELAAATVDEPDPSQPGARAIVEAWHLPPEVSGIDAWRAAEDEGPSLARPALFRAIDEEIRELERTRMKQALEAAGGKRGLAAELIGMPRRTFVTKARLYGLTGDRDDASS